MAKTEPKKPETRQEQPAEQQKPEQEIRRPMATPEPTEAERIEALELRIAEQQKVLDKLLPAVKKLDRHHFREWVD